MDVFRHNTHEQENAVSRNGGAEKCTNIKLVFNPDKNAIRALQRSAAFCSISWETLIARLSLVIYLPRVKYYKTFYASPDRSS